MSVRAFTAVLLPQGRARNLPGNAPEPRLEAALERTRSRWAENLRAIVTGPRAQKVFDGEVQFRDCAVHGRIPSLSLVWSTCWHIAAVILLLQFGRFILTVPHTTNFDNVELTWSGPIEDLPLLPGAPPAKRVIPPKQAPKPMPLHSADAFHPTQTIVSAPRAPTHPRQTLIRPDALQEAPKILPSMPNIVIWDQTPERPRLQITAEQFARIKPKEPNQRREASSAIPEIPNEEKRAADLDFAAAPPPPKPMLPIAPGAAMVAAPRSASQPNAKAAALPSEGGTRKTGERLIAISATPGPAAPEAPVPNGNLVARVTISPDKTADASAQAAKAPAKSGSANAGAAAEISITGGNPRKLNGVSGLGGEPGATSRSLHVTPGMAAPSGRSEAPSAHAVEVPIAARLKPGAPAEMLLTGRVYTLHVNMPNLSSAAGSWLLNFAEIDEFDPYAPPHARSGELTGPLPLHKVDPRYPPSLAQAKIQGEVVLYAIIRKDGSVDSIQLVHSLDPTLDQNAMEALAGWKFRPAERAGSAVALEAVIHIPFHTVAPEQ
jgi:TonB family protein